MGITFRSGDYIRFVRIGGRTIKDGEAAAIWNRKGVHTEIIGPQRVNLFFSTIRFLTRHKTESQQFLVVRHRNGNVEHIRGPATIYQNPSLHDGVSVKNGTFLKSSSDFVIVQNDGTSNIGSKETNGDLKPSVSLSKVQGPALFMPRPSEHIHEFSWSQINGEMLSTATDKFQILRTSLYPLNITLDVPISNSHHIKAALHLEYKIKSSFSVDVFLKYDDPIARIYQAMLADGQAIGDQITLGMVNAWEQEKMNAIFNNVASYSELLKTAEQCGFQIISVFLTGHSLSSELESLFNKERALSLELTSEIKAKTQRQQLRVLEEDERMKQIEVSAKLKRTQLESDDKLEKEMHSRKLDSLKRRAEVQSIETKTLNELLKMKDGPIVEFLQKVKDMDVDMTKFLTSVYGSENHQGMNTKHISLPNTM